MHTTPEYLYHQEIFHCEATKLNIGFWKAEQNMWTCFCEHRIIEFVLKSMYDVINDITFIMNHTLIEMIWCYQDILLDGVSLNELVVDEGVTKPLSILSVLDQDVGQSHAFTLMDQPAQLNFAFVLVNGQIIVRYFQF